MSDPTAAAVAIKLPPFWPSQPSIWFAQAEAQFALRGITSDSTKYYHVLAALDQDTAVRLSDVIQRPPESDKYESFKRRLIQVFDLQESERAERLLTLASTGLGDRSPSQLMEEILQLLGTRPFCFLCKQLFLRQLPTVVRTQLAEVDFSQDPRAIANQATVFWQTACLDKPTFTSPMSTISCPLDTTIAAATRM